MMQPEQTLDHASKETLLRFLDDEFTPEERTRVATHLETCSACRASLTDLERLTAGFTALLTEAHGEPSARTWTPPVRRRWSWPPWPLAAAAIFASLLIVSLAAPPLRAWIAERLGIISAPGAETEVTASSTTGTDRAGDANVLMFEPTEDVFTIEFSPEPVGRLEISTDAIGLASASIVRGVPPEIVVLSSGLRVFSDSTPVDYVVRLPASVRIIEVRAGSRTMASYTVSEREGDDRWELVLDGGTANANR